MMIKIAGFQKNSFIDYPGKIASVIFLGGCNFACHYCHNSDLLTAESNTIDFAEVLEEIKQQIGFIDGVVITGGEPTLHPHLNDIIREIKKLGLLVKLDTNGTNPKILQDIDVDYVAMDIKASLNRYKDIVGVNADEIQKSIDFLKLGKTDYMFRLTLSPLLNEDDIKQIGELVDGAKCFQLQQFVPNDFSNSHSVVHLPHSSETAKKFERILAKHCEKVVMRGF
jgi:pyruvate formate lyase activating enzyme